MRVADNPKIRKKWDAKRFAKTQKHEVYYRRRKKIREIYRKIRAGKKLTKSERKLLSAFLKRKR